MLTIGMATFQDFDGVYFTLESLHAHHPRCEYLVIDNSPQSCQRTRSVAQAVGGRYLHRPDLHGTSAPRDALFRLAKTPWVMCVDSHVLLETGAVQTLLDYIDENPGCDHLLTGPLIYDDGKSTSTHWRPDAGPGLWGAWASAWESPDGEMFEVIAGPSGAKFVRLDGSDYRLPPGQPQPGMDVNAWLASIGCTLGGTKPFDIPMQGLGLFAMRRAAWPGFHPKFRGFGGEEGYIHEKVRQRGGRNLCLPRLRWRHRFRHMEHGAPPPPYKIAREDHVWNLLIGHRELGIDAMGQIRATFGSGLPAGVFDALVAQAEAVQPWGESGDRKRRLKLLGIWYSNNAAPLPLMQKSLATIHRAVSETMHHDVEVCTSAWQPIAGNPFPCAVGRPGGVGYNVLIQQMRAAAALANQKFDAVVFLEHDVLINPGYFDRVGDAMATGAPVVSNLDYIGLNATGWLAIKELHEPLHELSMRRDVFFANLDRAERDCKINGVALLEPQDDRSDWVRLPQHGLCPNVHCNW